MRTTEGEVIYVAANDEHLTALCVQIGSGSNWVPSDLLVDITFPKLDEINVVHGMGLFRVDQYLPNWGLWGLSVKVKSSVATGKEFKEGPTYLFVIDQQRVVYRVRQQWSAKTAKPGSSTVDEQWTPIDPNAIRRAPCQPPK